MEFELRARAKVNLCLAVEYPPRCGYHALTSVFQELDLHDTLHFSVIEASRATGAEPTVSGALVAVQCAALDLPVRDNLIFKAVDAAERACGVRAAAPGNALLIDVEKRIPAGGGLGGGSSDAAATLKAYARLAGLDPLDGRLLSVARDLGADVAFFMYGGAALMDGRGDTLVRKLPSFPLHLVLMGSAEGIATGGVYAAFDTDPQAPGDAVALAAAIEAWDGADPDGRSALALAGLCTNNLEPAAFAAQASLERRVAAAKEHPNVLHALVTGSGATSYAICRTAEDAETFAQDMAPLCAWTHVVDLS